MTNRKVNLTIANMVVMLALIAALIGAGWQQVGAERGTPADECLAKVDKRANRVSPDCERDEKSEKGDDGMETIANLIGIDVRTLWGEIKAGKSIAEVAQANGIDPQTIIDALVAQKQAEIDELLAAGEISEEKAAAWQAELVEGVTFFVNETDEALENDGKRDEKGDDGMETIAALIGIDVDTLWSELKAGNSIAQVAQANGVEPQTIIDALVAQKQAEIDELLAAGEILEEKAAAWQAELVEGITSRVNMTFEGDRRKER